MGYVIHEGDCLEVMPQLVSRGVRADCCFADPPYSTPVITSYGRQRFRNVADLSIQETYMRAFKSALEQVLRSAAPVFIFCDDDYYPSIFRAFYDWRCSQLIVWDKGRIGMGTPFRARHELIFYACREPVDYNRTEGITHYPSVLNYAPVPIDERLHGAQKPVDLIADLLLGFTQPGDVVLDPFAGSCSTGVACQMTGREFVGVDLNGEICATGEARLKRASGIPCDIPRPVRAEKELPLFAGDKVEQAPRVSALY